MGRLTGLDALRGIAALCVVALHLENWLGFRIAPGGHLAVDFFFMLSGFVMARTYERRMAEGLSPLTFMRIRVRRLWPLLIVGSVLGFAAFGGPPWIMLALSVLCIPILWGPHLYPLNAPQWSIFFELIANALHVSILRRLATRHLGFIWLAAFIVLAAFAYRDGHVAFGSTVEQFVGGFPRVIASYVLGIILWRTWGDRAPFAMPPAITALIMPMAVLLPLLWGTYWLYDLTFVAVVNPLLLAGGLNWRAGRFGNILGAASYPVYILHIPVLLLFERQNPTVSLSIVLAIMAVLLLRQVLIRMILKGQPRPIRVPSRSNNNQS